MTKKKLAEPAQDRALLEVLEEPAQDRAEVLAEKIVKLQQRGAKIYAQIDPLLTELVGLAKHGQQFTIDGNLYDFTDQFGNGKLKAAKRMYFPRYTLARPDR